MGMRYLTGHKDSTRAHILQSAASQLRAKGLEAARLADIMQAAGMTNGGFYKHFESKESLVGEAVSNALTELAGQLTAKVRGLPPRHALRAIIEYYLSEEHLRHPEHGCAFAALGSELVRMPPAGKTRLSAALDAYGKQLAPLMPGDSPAERKMAFRLLFSSMAGCLTAARAEPDDQNQKALLRAGRAFFVRAFCGSESEPNREKRQ